MCCAQHRRCESHGVTSPLSNDDADVNKNGKKSLGLDWQNNNSARAHCKLPSLHDYDVKIPNFTFCGGLKHKTTTFFLFSWTSIESFKIQLKKTLPPTFDELNEMEYKRNKFEAAQNSLNSLFDVFFSRRCRYCTLYYVLKPPVIFFEI